MPTGSWIPDISYIEDNVDQVDAEDANRPLSQLDQRTQYLFDTIQNIVAGQLLVAWNAVLDPATIPGTPVYFDTNTNSYLPSLAEVNIAAGNNYGFATDRALVRGIVLNKSSATAGDVALFGRIDNAVWEIDWTAVIDTGAITPGVQFLSSVTPGEISTSRGNLSVYLGSLDSDGNMIFNPTINGSLRDHLHYRFRLLSAVVADTTTEGWAPATEFPNAPAGATYGYVVAKNADLAAVFPPVPIDGQYLEFEGRGVHADAYVVDVNGIWWKSATHPDALTVDSNFPTGSGYPRYYAFWMLRLNLGASFVSSLASSADPAQIPVVFQNADGVPSSAGALFAGIKESILVANDTDEGGLALKTIAGITGRRGPVVGRLFPGAGISLDGDFGNDTDGWYGGVTVTAGTSSTVTGLATVVALNNAADTFYGIIPVITFPKSRSSSVLVKVTIPTNIPTGRSVQLQLDVIGVAAGSPPLGVTYNRITAGVPISQTEVPLATLTPALVANQFTTVTTDLVAVKPGDTVLFRVSQANASLGYDVPLLRIQYNVVRTPAVGP